MKIIGIGLLGLVMLAGGLVVGPHDADGQPAPRQTREVPAQNIVDLLADGKIEAKAQGSDIEQVRLQIRRRVNHQVVVRIPVGTFFVSRDTSTQNMVTTTEETVTLKTNEWLSVSVAAACANRTRDIPGDGDRFDIRRSPDQKELTKLMPVLRRNNPVYAVRQAAVWIVTDNADYEDLGVLEVSSGPIGFGGTRMIKEAEAALAMKICDEAGIDVTKLAIWRDRDRIARGLGDQALKQWLRQRQSH